jgi:hypothetical protein
MVGSFTFLFFIVWFIAIVGIWHLYNEYFNDEDS